MMDISNATTLAAAIVALIAPALIQALKKIHPRRLHRAHLPRRQPTARRHRHRGHQWLHRIRVGRRARRRRRRRPSRVHAGEPSAERRT